MKFNKHFIHEGTHALFSASKNSWLNYDHDQIDIYIRSAEATKKGTELHNLAKMLIEQKQKLGRSSKTLNSYVNDAIGFRMRPEMLLVYSEYIFGTVDTIKFDEAKRLLRIHDLKTGVNKTSEKQLYIYAALFCLEYDFRPFDIDYELRIYQNDEIRIYIPEPEEIAVIIDKIIMADRRVREIKAEEDNE